MRRKNAISVRVRNPARGLVTRLPGEEADLMRPGDKDRVFTDAQNARFEDGVVCAAPGYKNAQLVTPILTDIVSHWRFDELQQDYPGDLVVSRDEQEVNPFINDGNIPPSASGYAPGKIGRAAVVCDRASRGFLNAPDSDSLGLNHFTFTGWFQRKAQDDDQYLLRKAGSYSVGFLGNKLRVVLTSNAGLTNTVCDSSVSLSLDVWYFVSVTYDGANISVQINDGAADTSVLTDTLDLTPGEPLTVGNLDSTSKPFWCDSFSLWSRVLTSGELTALYAGGDGLDYPFLGGPLTLIFQGSLIDDSDPRPLTVASGGNLFSVDRSYDAETQEFVATLDLIYDGVEPPDREFGWTAVDFYDKEIYAQHDNPVQYWKPAMALTKDVPGLPADDAKWDGVESFFGHLILWKGDRFKWSAQDNFSLWYPVALTAATFAMTVDAPGFVQPAVTASVVIPTVEDPATEGVVVGQVISIDDVQSGYTYTNYYQVTAISTGPNTITGTLLDLTGHTATGLTVAAADNIFSVDANDSGESHNVGSHVNGEIFQILAQGDYAYVFKERSIQSMQFVGLAAGVFFLHPEISNEGLLSRNSLLGLGDGRMIFVGHREIYSYIGGPTLTPIVPQFSRQFYAELDRTRLDEILLFHKEFKNEVWIQYPVVGGHKVLIWNYREDTASIDIYDAARHGITAVAEVEWSVDPSWDSLAESVTWDSFDSSLSWDDMTSTDSQDRFTLMAFGDGRLAVHGVGFSRDGEAYTALAETQDFDCDEPDVFKYVDVILVGLQVRLPESVVRRVFVQLGYRDWLDSTIKWTAAIPIQVQGGHSPPPLKLNPGGSGRFLRLRFYSNEVDVPWRVTSYEIHSRPGSFY